MTKDYVGAYLAIPAGDKSVLAKVIFASSYFANVIALKLYAGSTPEQPMDVTSVEELPFKLFYTGAQPIKSKRWPIIGKGGISSAERELTRRTSGGEVWVEDTHLGLATDADLQTIPKMLVMGGGLIEKYATSLSKA